MMVVIIVIILIITTLITIVTTVTMITRRAHKLFVRGTTSARTHLNRSGKYDFEVIFLAVLANILMHNAPTIAHKVDNVKTNIKQTGVVHKKKLATTVDLQKEKECNRIIRFFFYHCF